MGRHYSRGNYYSRNESFVGLLGVVALVLVALRIVDRHGGPKAPSPKRTRQQVRESVIVFSYLFGMIAFDLVALSIRRVAYHSEYGGTPPLSGGVWLGLILQMPVVLGLCLLHIRWTKGGAGRRFDAVDPGRAAFLAKRRSSLARHG